MVSRHPFQSLRQLAVAMFDWEKDMVNKLPPGAVFRVPQRSSYGTIRRYTSHFGSGTQMDTGPMLLCRYLKAMGLNSHRAARVPMLTKAHMKKRLAFCNAMIAHKWSRVCSAAVGVAGR